MIIRSIIYFYIFNNINKGMYVRCPVIQWYQWWSTNRRPSSSRDQSCYTPPYEYLSKNICSRPEQFSVLMSLNSLNDSSHVEFESVSKFNYCSTIWTVHPSMPIEEHILFIGAVIYQIYHVTILSNVTISSGKSEIKCSRQWILFPPFRCSSLHSYAHSSQHLHSWAFKVRLVAGLSPVS